MRKFVESDKVDLVVGIQGSNIALAVLNYVKQSKAFLLVSGAGTDAITWQRVPYLFRSSISSWQLCHPFAEWIYDNLGKDMVVISEDYAGGHDVADEITSPTSPRAARSPRRSSSPSASPITAPISPRFASLDPKVVYDFSTGGAHAMRFVQQWAESGIKAQSSPALPGSPMPHRRGAGQGRARRHHLDHLYRHARQAREQEIRQPPTATRRSEYPNLFSDYGYVSMQVHRRDA